jgi:subtilisin-like proprotein convertase family protein
MPGTHRRLARAPLLLAVALATSGALVTLAGNPQPAAAFTHGYNRSPDLEIPDDAYNGQITSMASDTVDASSIPRDHIVTDVELRIWMSHSWVGDLTIKLAGPDGTVLTLLERPRGDGAADPSGDNGASSAQTDNSDLLVTDPITFSDDAFLSAEQLGAGRSETQSACVVPCEFRPTPQNAGGPGSFREAFGGQVARGAWTLLLGDSSPADVGRVQDWSLVVRHVRPLEACAGRPFPDVAVEDQFCEEIQWMRDEAISTGFSDGSYRPAQAVSRQAMSAFLARLGDAALTPCTTAPFPDVAVDHPFCPEIAWMKARGISSGFSDGTYRPSAVVTRQAMSSFLWKLVGGSLRTCTAAPFSDVAQGHPFCEEIRWMRDNGISTGFSDGSYRPGAPVTRQAMSAFMYRASFRM